MPQHESGEGTPSGDPGDRHQFAAREIDRRGLHRASSSSLLKWMLIKSGCVAHLSMRALADRPAKLARAESPSGQSGGVEIPCWGTC
jgi:hypothetical protein